MKSLQIWAVLISWVYLANQLWLLLLGAQGKGLSAGWNLLVGQAQEALGGFGKRS